MAAVMSDHRRIFDPEPLFQIVARNMGLKPWPQGEFPISKHRDPGAITSAQIACYLEVSEKTIHRYRDEWLTMLLADRLAVRIGRHPAEVWPEWCNNIELEAVAA